MIDKEQIIKVRDAAWKLHKVLGETTLENSSAMMDAADDGDYYCLSPEDTRAEVKRLIDCADTVLKSDAETRLTLKCDESVPKGDVDA